jgi:hypothetical protein
MPGASAASPTTGLESSFIAANSTSFPIYPLPVPPTKKPEEPQANGWENGRDSLPVGRALEFTETRLLERFMPNGLLDLPALIALPTLFVKESSPEVDEIARVGTITNARISGNEIILYYTYDPEIPGLPNSLLQSLGGVLGFEDFQFSRTHWAVHDADLFRALLRGGARRRHQPRVFHLAEPENIEASLVSAMMPFSASFDGVYQVLQDVAGAVGLRCRRADDIWDNPAVMQDVVSLIDRSRVVIADCTGRNPNVFYEIGIAHTLGRDVLLITQNDADIPFDLRHLRYVKYLNNGEGLAALNVRLRMRLAGLAQ